MNTTTTRNNDITMTQKTPQFGEIFYHEMPFMTFENGVWSEMFWQSSNQLNLHPGSHVLHYGSSCFEGLKAFKQENGKVALFRPEENAKRMRGSARLMHLPQPKKMAFLEAVCELTNRASSLIPSRPGSLYLRPTLIGTDFVIGKASSPSAQAMWYVLACPVGDYLSPDGVSVAIETDLMRCAHHMGQIKCGGNYASALPLIQNALAEKGVGQVLFCPDGDVQETATSNFFVILGEEIITKPLTSSFLHGITRDSVLILAQKIGFTAIERDFNVDELKTWVKDGAEAILTGTAVSVNSVNAIIFPDGEKIEVKQKSSGEKLRKTLSDIQFGVADDIFDWMTYI